MTQESINTLLLSARPKRARDQKKVTGFGNTAKNKKMQYAISLIESMRPENHVKKFKKIRESIDKLLTTPPGERDDALITTAAHWAAFHLISAIINQLPIPEQQKHRNHRGIKYILRDSTEVQTHLGVDAQTLLIVYNDIETHFMAKFQYGGEGETPDYTELLKKLQTILDICKKVTRNYSMKGP